MPKKALFGLVVGLLMLAPAALAESTDADGVDLAADELVVSLAAPSMPGCEEEPVLTPAGKGSVVYTAGGCSATASCLNDNTPSVSCSVSGSSGTCSFQDASCSPETRGWVECNGVRTWCPPPDCGFDCSSLNYPGCSYFWNSVLGCCSVKASPGQTCLQAC